MSLAPLTWSLNPSSLHHLECRPPQTRGILTYCSDTFPGAFHPEVRAQGLHAPLALRGTKKARATPQGTLASLSSILGFDPPPSLNPLLNPFLLYLPSLLSDPRSSM